jgi:hypothetical protein
VWESIHQNVFDSKRQEVNSFGKKEQNPKKQLHKMVDGG